MRVKILKHRLRRLRSSLISLSEEDSPIHTAAVKIMNGLMVRFRDKNMNLLEVNLNIP